MSHNQANHRQLDRFYFTFGSDNSFPFQSGWIIIEAPDIRSAAKIFKSYYPNPSDDDVLNCSDYYTAAEFEVSDMFKTDNRGARCHLIIGPHI